MPRPNTRNRPQLKVSSSIPTGKLNSQNDAINHLGEQRRAKTQQCFGLVLLLRTDIRRENLKSRQPILMLSTEYVEEVVPLLARNLLGRHSLSSLQLSARGPR